jgi:hypothetical protein
MDMGMDADANTDMDTNKDRDTDRAIDLLIPRPGYLTSIFSKRFNLISGIM